MKRRGDSVRNEQQPGDRCESKDWETEMTTSEERNRKWGSAGLGHCHSPTAKPQSSIRWSLSFFLFENGKGLL